MLYYPKIPDTTGCPGGRCVGFEKLDGTNLHFDWHRDYGWHSFGTRRDVFNLDALGEERFLAAHPGLEGARAAFESTLANDLDRIFRERFPEHVAFRAFAEFLGEHSFAGEHVSHDPKRTILFDVLADWSDSNVGEARDPMGLLGPDEFLSAFGGLREIAKVVYRGKFHGQIVEDVRRGTLAVDEGVVFKGGSGPTLWRAKVKTDAYRERLKASLGPKWIDHWE